MPYVRHCFDCCTVYPADGQCACTIEQRLRRLEKRVLAPTKAEEVAEDVIFRSAPKTRGEQVAEDIIFGCDIPLSERQRNRAALAAAIDAEIKREREACEAIAFAYNDSPKSTAAAIARDIRIRSRE